MNDVSSNKLQEFPRQDSEKKNNVIVLSESGGFDQLLQLPRMTDHKQP